MRRLVVVFMLVALGLPAGGSLAHSGSTQSETLSVDTRLEERRFVVAGARAYEVGTEDGRFPAMGFHTRGEMGGIWSPPIKLLDGVWFGLDKGPGSATSWIGPARRFTSGYGHVRMDLPGTSGVAVERTDFVPDGARAVLIRLRLRALRDTRLDLMVHAHSELMGAYPWGETEPSQLDYNLRDEVSFADGALVFRDRGRPAVENASPHDWAALVGASRQPSGHALGRGFRGPQEPAVICPPSPEEAPDRCDDTAYGKGAGGRLSYDLELDAGESETLWIAVAGSDAGLEQARAELGAALDNPQGALEDKLKHRRALADRTRLHLPDDPLLAEAIEWSKQNLADSVQEAHDLAARVTHAGVDYPAPAAEIERARFFAAGYPDYPWLFATDGEYTAYAAVAVGQFGPIKDHLRALRDVSRAVNGNSGKVVHEVVTDGTVYFGANDDPGNTDETAKLPSAVALVWRWTGDDAFLAEMYPFAVRNMRYIFRELDRDRDGWPEGLGNVEREGMGEEKLDVTVYAIRGLGDLADMAESVGDDKTWDWATRKARFLERRFEAAWWMPGVPQHADSLASPDNSRLQQRHWIGVTPMEVELVRSGETRPGLATTAQARRALALRETSCYGNAFGLFHTGAPGCDPVQSSVPAERVIFTLNSSIMAVAEGNYGRLDAQRRFVTANRRLQLPVFDEQPGAMPEIAPSPDYGRSIDLPLTERAMVLQAWGNYGTIWPVVHQQLGVSPDLGRNKLEVAPQLPPGAPEIGAENIRLGAGSIDVEAAASGGVYETMVETSGLSGVALTLGHVLPRDAEIQKVILDGNIVPYHVRIGHRGPTVLVRAPSGERHILIVVSS